MAVKIGVISLGCAKNRVDTEVMLGILAEEGYEFVQDMEKADIALINTCAFVSDAKEESIDTVLEAEQQKKFGHLKGIIVTGCLTQRYQDELKELLPRVDCFLGVAAYKDIAAAVKTVLDGKKMNDYPPIDVAQDFKKRIVTTQKPTAYVKIAEGCDNNCNYCVIPQIRGGYQSRDMDSILEEIAALTADGYSEIILVAQDTTNYGNDIYGKPALAELMDRAAGIEGVKWLRVLYSYPDGINDELLAVMLKHDNIVKYVDIPLQHLDNDILKAMNRRNTCETSTAVIEKIHAASPDFVIRTTIIVGFPGESRLNISTITKHMKDMAFDHLGVFTYSCEEGTPAAKLGGQVDETEMEFRRDAVLNMQAPISLAKNRARVGKTLEVLVEGHDEYSGRPYGRCYAQAPDVDGKVFINSKTPLTPGEYYNIKITDAYNYDCVGEYEPESGE